MPPNVPQPPPQPEPQPEPLPEPQNGHRQPTVLPDGAKTVPPIQEPSPRPGTIEVVWPNGLRSHVRPGCDWLQAARDAGVAIPTGCLGGSCGACEIDVNGRTVRACLATVPATKTGCLRVELAMDPHW